MESMMSNADPGMVTFPTVKKEEEKGLSPSSPQSASCLMPNILKNNNEYGNTKVFGDSSEYSPDSPESKYYSSTTQDPLSDAILLPENFDYSSPKEDDEMPRRLCLVCGDIASGFHYGVASCEACKAFFKRTIQGNIEYTCLAANDCEINKRRRKACQACRFQKCLQKGMLKEGVRLDRVRGGRQKYRRNTQVPYAALSPQKSSIVVEDNKMLEILMHCEPELPNASVPDGESPLTASLILNILSNLYDRELVSIIGWAKQIPGFTDLSLNNQMKLLQSTWTEILTFTFAYRSLTASGKLMFATDFFLDESQAQECGASELFQLCVTIKERLRQNLICKEEFLLLKALVLANSDVPLDEAIPLKQFRDTIMNALIDCAAVTRGNSADITNLLLCLPVIRQADGIVRKFWLSMRQSGAVLMNKLFIEMLDNSHR